jgi:hypothetical protein
MHRQNGSDILLHLTVAGCLISAVVTIISFFLYVRTRLADRSPDIHSSEEDYSRHLRRLDGLEERYRSVHFVTLALLLIQLSHRLNQPILTG